jgi:3-isopropylmalate/(R)-2-methylmalate dehydratase small subunit
MSLPTRALITGRGIPVMENDIDTDRIIPARFMKTVTFEGLGQYAFYDARFNEDGSKKGHPFDLPQFQGGTILITGRNFGCGSSREHAPQALHKYGIQAIIGESFAEIFIGNCTSLGIPCVSLNKEDVESLAQLVEENPEVIITIDLNEKLVKTAEQNFYLEINESFRKSLAEGIWDTTAELLQNKEKIKTLYDKLPYTKGFVA